MLEDRLIQAVEETLFNIRDNPLMYPKEIQGYRKAFVGGKPPYNVFYRMDEKKVVVVSIYHASRESEGWNKSR